MRKTWWLLAVLVLPPACTSSGAPSAPTAGTPLTTTTTSDESTTQPLTTASPTDGETLRVGTVAPITTLDPADAFTLPEWEVLHNIGQGLLVRDPASGDLVPGIAEELPEVSEDGRTYEFRLRPDVRFADGTELTAPLYVEQLQRVLLLDGQVSDLVTSFVDDVEAVDEQTIVFTLGDDVAFFPTVLTGAPYLPSHPDAFPAEELVAFPEAPVYGVGPWFIASLSETELVLEPNPYVESDATTGVERVVIRRFEMVDDMVAALIAGDLDVIWRGLDAQAVADLGAVDGITVETVPAGTTHFLVVNHGREPTDDPLVRRALAELIDRDAVAEDTLGGTVEPLFSAVLPGLSGSIDSFRDLYGEPDVGAAVDLLREAGYTEANPAEIELAYPPERYGVEIAQAMEDVERQIESTGLVNVTLTAQMWNAYVGDLVEGQYHLAFLGWLSDFPDPHNYLAPFVLDGGMGGSAEEAGLDRPEIVEMVTEAAVEPDAAKREALYGQIQQLYAEDVVTLPLWLDPEHIAYWDHVAGDADLPYPETLNIGPTMHLDYSVVRIEEEDSGF